MRDHAAVFVDRDGTLNYDREYLASPDDFELLPNVAEAVRQLNLADLKVILVTNQSGIARGYFSLGDLEAIHRTLKDRLAAAGAWLDDVLFCPHHPEEGCRCRKPNPGMIERALANHAIDLSQSYVVGDRHLDVELAYRVKAKSVLVMTGSNSEDSLAICAKKNLPIDCIAPCFADAVSWILRPQGEG